MGFNHCILLFCSLKHTSVLGFARRQEAVAHLSQENVFSGINIEIMEVKCGRKNHWKKRMDKIILYCTEGEETIFNLHNCNSASLQVHVCNLSIHLINYVMMCWSWRSFPTLCFHDWYKESIICQHIDKNVSDSNGDEEVSQLNAGFLIVAQPLMADRTNAWKLWWSILIFFPMKTIQVKVMIWFLKHHIFFYKTSWKS